ncbi:UNVERIFIED_CONTAM: hypothetical protein Sradi_3815400 [Sesamum radiatum]|uniref:Zinc knuckle CX2CX4HX4C domain-containing protein n=1 Tax=Sesamum radiatum TaxID=300843 RepID=A0AAW2Q0T7_SESRA
MLNLVKGLEMRRLPDGRFFIRFNHIIDRNHALDGCPWSFGKNTLIMSSTGENKNTLHVDLDWCDFFIYVHDLLLSKMNLGVAFLIGNTLEKFWDMEMEEFGKAWGSSLRIKVAINVTQPLVCVLLVCTTMGEELVVSFTYERLQNFCCLCRRLGHIHTYCESSFEGGCQDPGEDLPYGAWFYLRVGDHVQLGRCLSCLWLGSVDIHIRLGVRRCLVILEANIVLQALALARSLGSRDKVLSKEQSDCLGSPVTAMGPSTVTEIPLVLESPTSLGGDAELGNVQRSS